VKNVKDDLDLGWGEEKKKKPTPRPLPTRSPRPKWTHPVAILAAVAVALVLGLAFGSNSGQRAAREAVEAQTAAENTARMFEQERDTLNESLAAITERVDDLESDLASATAAAEDWRVRAEDSSATAAAIRDDNTALKAEVARLQQMKRTAPATDSVKQASATTTSTAGWQTAKVSWYGPGFYGRKTASGAVLTQGMMNVAHKSMPFGTRIEFRYKGRTAVAVVNDRGPFVAGRTFDLGPGTAQALGFSGVGNVEWRKV
jgi:rare lipoprotein A (peptidoglycan hydrolase)